MQMEEKPSTMISSPPPTNYGAKTTQELSIEGQKHLEETIEAAFSLLSNSAMIDEVCNRKISSNTSDTPPANANINNLGGGSTSVKNAHHVNGDALSDSSSSASSSASLPRPVQSNYPDVDDGAVDEVGLKYAASVAALRSILTAISDKAKAAKAVPASTAMSPAEQTEIENLEVQASTLKKELEDKNKYLKLLIDQHRNLLADISTWGSPCSV